MIAQFLKTKVIIKKERLYSLINKYWTKRKNLNIKGKLISKKLIEAIKK